jgi:hypothetical protein
MAFGRNNTVEIQQELPLHTISQAIEAIVTQNN